MSDYFCDFWRYLPTHVLYTMYYLSLYICLCTMSDVPWHTYLPKNRTSIIDVPSLKIVEKEECRMFQRFKTIREKFFKWESISIKQIKLKEQRMSTKKRSIEIFRLKLTNTPDATDATRFRLFPVWSHSISGRRTISQHPAIIVWIFIC